MRPIDIKCRKTTNAEITPARQNACAAERASVNGDLGRLSTEHGRDSDWRQRKEFGEDSELMHAAVAGDSAAYRLLLRRLRPRLGVFFARKLWRSPSEVDDLVQETLLTIHDMRETFDCRRAFTPWADAIARNKLADHFRRSRRRTMVPIDCADALFTDDASAAVEARCDVEKMLAFLPERSRALLRNVKLEGLSTAEAAARYGLSQSGVKVGVHRSLRRLAALLHGGDHADAR
jgi:RNA polymerase sigma-70 factor (ECF subfamily)